eukprot:gene12406-13690_t
MEVTTNRLNFSPLSEERLLDAFTFVKYFFNITKLLPDQESALREFFSGQNLYFSAPTGYGKSLIFQCLPLMADVLKDQLVGTCKALVISPLKSLMLDQVAKMKLGGVTAAAIYDGQDADVLDAIENGDYSLIYASSESVLTTDRWRKLFSSKYFKENCEILVIDEAHCIVHWGTTDADTNKIPFRKWYGNLLELKSLLSNPRIAIFTATASKKTRRKIFELLQLHAFTTKKIEKNPNKDNIRYAVQHNTQTMQFDISHVYSKSW